MLRSTGLRLQINGSFIWIVTYAVIIYEAFFGSFELFKIGSYHFSLQEVAIISLALYLVVTVIFPTIASPERFKYWRLDPLSCLCGMIGMLMLINLARGITSDPGRALFAERAIGLSALVFLLPIFIKNFENLRSTCRNIILISGYVLAVLCFLRLMFGVKLFLHAFDDTDVNDIDANRLLTASGAVILGVSIVLLASEVLRQIQAARFKISKLVVLFAMFLMIVLSEQRTAVIGTVLGLFCVFLFEPGRLQTQRRLVGIAVLSVGAFFAVDASIEGKTIAETVISLFNRNYQPVLQHGLDNMTTRRNVWSGLLTDMSQNWGDLNQMIGLPAGTSAQIYVPTEDHSGQILWHASIHSMYYGLLPLSGWLGLGLYLSVLAWGIAQNVAMSFRSEISPSIFSLGCRLGFLALLVVFGYSYELRYGMVLVLVLALPIGEKMFVRTQRARRLQQPGSPLPRRKLPKRKRVTHI